MFRKTIFTAFLWIAATLAGRAQNALKQSPGNTTYFVDPVKGRDSNTGTKKAKAWRSFAHVNQLKLAGGDKVIILSPGDFHHSLIINGKGSAQKPVNIVFTPGQYHIYDDQAYRTKLAISNTNDVPDWLKAIALYINHSQYVHVNARGAKLVLHAKMIETYVDHSSHISLSGISYDYNIPTVSEFKVNNLQPNYADLSVNAKNRYSIKDSMLSWEGDGWKYRSSWYWQEYDPANGFVTRKGLSLDKARFADMGKGKVRVFFTENPGFKLGFIYQTRDVTRDCAGIFMERSNDLTLKNIRIYFMHGMGVVSQFCKNITMDSMVVKPDEASGRTCAAWADILHFSSCAGLIDIRNSYLSAANDDAVNVHGVHLRIVERLSPNQLKVRFMHGQTYGFNPYMPGDSVGFIHGNSLLQFGDNVIMASKMLNEKEALITLKKPTSTNFQTDDALENITWTPRVHIQNTTITSIPTRGILVTTRRKTIIEHSTFLRVNSSAVLVEDDAEGWYESGMVKDLTIRNNNFYYCGEPVISIHPENIKADGAVHSNISITGNKFTLQNQEALATKSTANISFSGNTIYAPGNGDKLTSFQNSADIKLGDNKLIKKDK